jgi:hypothetical protein
VEELKEISGISLYLYGKLICNCFKKVKVIFDSKASVEIGGLKLENIYLGIALDIDIPILEDVIWDGIVGLSFQNRKLKQQNIPTLFDQIMGWLFNSSV